MEIQTIQMSQRQRITLDLLNDPQIVDMLWGGGAGGGKSMMVCLWMAMQAREYPGIRIGLGRKEITRLKQTTLITLLREAQPILNLKRYVYSDQKGLVSYINGSSIQLVDLAPQPSDPNYDRFGSFNFTHIVIEEAGEVQQKARDIFISRKNRFLNKEHHLVGKSISTCNPSQNYLKQEYYKPYVNLGGGDYQKWEYGQVEIEMEMKTAYRAFVRSLAKDNPFLPQNYIEVLRKLPDPERKRLLEGNWDFEDTDTMLFKPITIDRSLTENIEEGRRFIGVDIADTGSDKTVLSMVEGNILADQQEIKVDKEEAIGEQIALEIIKYAQQNAIEKEDIAIDSIGIGASTRDFLRSKGWGVKEFIAGAASQILPNEINTFRNLRGANYYNMSIAMNEGRFKIYKNLPTLDILRDQLMAHEYKTEERVILVKPKKEIRETLGLSPDYADSALIAFWVSLGDADPRRDTSRVVF